MKAEMTAAKANHDRLIKGTLPHMGECNLWGRARVKARDFSC